MAPVFAFFFFNAAKIRFLCHAANFGVGTMLHKELRKKSFRGVSRQVIF
jgi:hypothetical protein